MIRTEAWMNPSAEKIRCSRYASTILKAFELQTSTQTRGKIAWYWRIMEMLHFLDVKAIGGFQALKTLESDKERYTISQIVCWVLAGYSINVFATNTENSERLGTLDTVASTIETYHTLSSFERAYEFYFYVFKGSQYVFEIERMHKIYSKYLRTSLFPGPLICINPYEIHVNDTNLNFRDKLYLYAVSDVDKF
jgi:hypothetical protein